MEIMTINSFCLYLFKVDKHKPTQKVSRKLFNKYIVISMQHVLFYIHKLISCFKPNLVHVGMIYTQTNELF